MADATECHCHSGQYIPASIRAWLTVLSYSSSAEKKFLRPQHVLHTTSHCFLASGFHLLVQDGSACIVKGVRLLYFCRASGEEKTQITERAVEELYTLQSPPIAALLLTPPYIKNDNTSSYLGFQQPDVWFSFLTEESRMNLFHLIIF